MVNSAITALAKFQQYGYQHVGLIELYADIEIRHCSGDLCSCPMFSKCSIPCNKQALLVDVVKSVCQKVLSKSPNNYCIYDYDRGYIELA